MKFCGKILANKNKMTTFVPRINSYKQKQNVICIGHLNLHRN